MAQLSCPHTPKTHTKSVLALVPTKLYLRCIVLVPLSQNIQICPERFQSKHHPLHPGHPSLEEPHKLVDVMPGDLLWLIQEENSVKVSFLQGPERSPILTGSYRKIAIAV